MTELEGHILNATARAFKMKGGTEQEVNTSGCAVMGKQSVKGWCDCACISYNIIPIIFFLGESVVNKPFHMNMRVTRRKVPHVLRIGS